MGHCGRRLCGCLLRIERRRSVADQGDGYRSWAAGNTRELHLPWGCRYSDAPGRCADARFEVGGLSGGMRESSLGKDWDDGRDCEGGVVSGFGRFVVYDGGGAGGGWRGVGGLTLAARLKA